MYFLKKKNLFKLEILIIVQRIARDYSLKNSFETLLFHHANKVYDVVLNIHTPCIPSWYGDPIKSSCYKPDHKEL